MLFASVYIFYCQLDKVNDNVVFVCFFYLLHICIPLSVLFTGQYKKVGWKGLEIFGKFSLGLPTLCPSKQRTFEKSGRNPVEGLELMIF